MPLPITTPSIHDLVPLESGGEISRNGFTYQDYIAVNFFLSMLLENEIAEVWCETQDDITLILNPSLDNNHCEVEFVQVKANELGKFWSLADICRRDSQAKKQDGTSILEKSLANDRCVEKCRFNIVTLTDISNDAKLLALPLGSPLRKASSNEFVDLCSNEKFKKLSNFSSQNKNGYLFWLSNVVWRVAGKQSSVKNENLVKLLSVLNLYGYNVFPDQIEEVHNSMLQLAKETAEAKWVNDPSKKKINKSNLQDWFVVKVKKALKISRIGVQSALASKLDAAGLKDYIENASESRLHYLNQVRSNQYLDLGNREKIIGDVNATLSLMKSELDSGQVSEGIDFLNMCLRQLVVLHNSSSSSGIVSIQFFHGCMYDVVDRCLHRFVRIST